MAHRCKRDAPGPEQPRGPGRAAAGVGDDAHIAGAARADGADASHWAVGAGGAVGQASAGRLAVGAEAGAARDRGAHARAAGPAGGEGVARLAGAGVGRAGAVGTHAGVALLEGFIVSY